jgi:hypothetical protein
MPIGVGAVGDFAIGEGEAVTSPPPPPEATSLPHDDYDQLPAPPGARRIIDTRGQREAIQARLDAARREIGVIPPEVSPYPNLDTLPGYLDNLPGIIPGYLDNDPAVSESPADPAPFIQAFKDTFAAEIAKSNREYAARVARDDEDVMILIAALA